MNLQSLKNAFSLKSIKSDYNNNNLPFIIIGINIMIFVLYYYVFNETLDRSNPEYLLPYEVSLHANSITQPHSIIASYFMHGGLLHVFMNMLCVYQLRHAVSSIYNRREQIFLYFIAGFFINLLLVPILIFIDYQSIAIGYSGVVFALIGSIFKFLPKKEQKRQALFLGGFHLIIFLGVPIFWQGHLAGFIFGYTYSHFRIFKKKRKSSKQKDKDFDDLFSKSKNKNRINSDNQSETSTKFE
jgi:rhomboid protease GluP